MKLVITVSSYWDSDRIKLIMFNAVPLFAGVLEKVSLVVVHRLSPAQCIYIIIIVL